MTTAGKTFPEVFSNSSCQLDLEDKQNEALKKIKNNI